MIHEVNVIMNHIYSTLSVQTINRGMNIYFRVDDEQKKLLADYNTQYNICGIPGLDVIYNNGFGFLIMDPNYSKSYIICNQPKQLAKLPFDIFDIILKHNRLITKTQLYCDSNNDSKDIFDNLELIGEFKTDKDILVEELLTCLNPSEFDTKKEWMKIARACKFENISYSILDKWSKKCPNYNQDGQKQLWKSIINNYKGIPITLGSIHNLAKKSNPSLYKSIITKNHKKEES